MLGGTEQMSPGTDGKLGQAVPRTKGCPLLTSSIPKLFPPQLGSAMEGWKKLQDTPGRPQPLPGQSQGQFCSWFSSLTFFFPRPGGTGPLPRSFREELERGRAAGSPSGRAVFPSGILPVLPVWGRPWAAAPLSCPQLLHSGFLCPPWDPQEPPEELEQGGLAGSPGGHWGG